MTAETKEKIDAGVNLLEKALFFVLCGNLVVSYGQLIYQQDHPRTFTFVCFFLMFVIYQITMIIQKFLMQRYLSPEVPSITKDKPAIVSQENIDESLTQMIVYQTELTDGNFFLCYRYVLKGHENNPKYIVVLSKDVPGHIVDTHKDVSEGISEYIEEQYKQGQMGAVAKEK